MALSSNPEKMFGFRQALTKAADFLVATGADSRTKQEVGHAYICYTIIQLIRVCGQFNKTNRQKIHELVRRIVNDPITRKNLDHYSPTKGDSRIIPFLIRLKLVWLIIFACKHKAESRYKRERAMK